MTQEVPAMSRILLTALTAVLIVTAIACDPGGPDVTAPRQQSPTIPASDSGYRPDIDPSNFVDVIDNPLLPLEPGMVFNLRGETEDGVEHETVRVTARTKEVLGVRTTVVKDVVRVDGELAEFTYDWYAQDRDGNVWYFGEDTAEYERGEVVSRQGSWEAGVDGARPGIIMNAHPQVTDSHRQEYYRGEAEDMYWVVATGESRSVPFGDFENVVRTLEWSPLEPNVVVEKFYAPGVGLLAERALAGGKENVELLRVTRRG
jgi:hypothetical protein